VQTKWLLTARPSYYRAEDLLGSLGVLWSQTHDIRRAHFGLSKEEEFKIEVFGGRKDENGGFHKTAKEIEDYDEIRGFLGHGREHYRRLIKQYTIQHLQFLDDIILVPSEIECRRPYGSQYNMDRSSTKTR